MKKVISFATMLVLVLSFFFQAYASDISTLSDPILSSSVCSTCNIRMNCNGSDVYEYRYQRLNKSCPNSNVEEGSHPHFLFYNDYFYICPNCSYSGIMRVLAWEECQLSRPGRK